MPILARMPEIARGFELNVGHGEVGLGKHWSLARRLRSERYDRAIVLPRSLKAALVPLLASIPVRTGFLGEHRYGLINDVRPLDEVRLDQTVKRFAALGLERGEPLPALDPPLLEVRPESLHALRTRLGLDDHREAVALLPGAEYGPAKQWPLEQYKALARQLAAAGVTVWVLGSERERALGDAIAASIRSNGVRNLCGETKLEEAVDLLSAAAVAVTNDSGLMHVAAAAGTHVVAIYGSSSPDYTPPLTPNATVVYQRLHCSPCFERTCPLGHLRCLRDISADAVVSAVTDVLQARMGAKACRDADLDGRGERPRG
jgi:heptosyltransferase-2